MAEFFDLHDRPREALNIYVYLANITGQQQDGKHIFRDKNKPCELYKAAGDRLLDLGQYAAARQFLEEALHLAKGIQQQGPIWESLGEACFHLQDWPAAQEHYRKALDRCIAEKGPDSPICMTIRANLEKSADTSGAC